MKTEREFSKMCKERGFARMAPRLYARCIGDGIFQTIDTGHKKYMDPFCEQYSLENRKSYCVRISLYSLYSELDEIYFNPKAPGRGGQYSPFDLCARKKCNRPFCGIEEEYEAMEREVFDILDSINTQEAYLSWWETVEVTAYGQRLFSKSLVAPFLLCGRLTDAQFEVAVGVLECFDAYGCNIKRLTGSMEQDVVEIYGERVGKDISHGLALWKMMRIRPQELNSYVLSNYMENMEWVEKYGIPTYLNETPRTVPLKKE